MTNGEETVTDVLLREIRELGEAIICLDQHPSLISKPALGNTYTTFAFNLKHRGDIAMMQDCLHLDGEQACRPVQKREKNCSGAGRSSLRTESVPVSSRSRAGPVAWFWVPWAAERSGATTVRLLG